VRLPVKRLSSTNGSGELFELIEAKQGPMPLCSSS